MKRYIDLGRNLRTLSFALKANDRASFRWLVLALSLVAFGVRVYHLDYQSLWRDEVDSLIFATSGLQTLLANFTKPGENGPLYFLLLRPWIHWTGASEFSLRFFSLLFGTLTVPLVYTVGRRLFDWRVGILGACIAAVSPYYVWYSQETKMYALLTFLSLLSVYLCLLAMDRNRLWLWAVFIVVTSLSLYVHFFSALVIAFEGCLFLAGISLKRVPLRPGVAAFALLVAPYLPLAMWEWPTLLNPPTSTYPFLDLGRILSVLVFAWSLSSSPIPTLPLQILFVFLLQAGVLLYTAHPAPGGSVHPGITGALARHVWSCLRLRSGVAVLIAYLLVPVLGYYLVSLRLPLFADRYLIIVSPAYYLLLACGLVAVRQRSIGASGLCLFLIVGFSVYCLWFQSHTEIKDDFRSAARYFSEHSNGGEPIIFVMPYAKGVFSYYHQGALNALESPYTNAGISPEQVDAQLGERLRNTQKVWLLLSEEELYDRRGLAKSWLDRNATVLESQRFARVALYHYAIASANTRTMWLPLLPGR